MLQSLRRKLVAGQVIFFPVMRGSSAVRMRGQLVKFGRSLVRIVWHDVSPRLPL
jgi:hypothetical protein